MTKARPDGLKRRGALTREIGYQKVVLAVHVLADEAGLVPEFTPLGHLNHLIQ